MLSPRTSGGQYLSRTWARDRAEAADDPTVFTAAELARLEVPAGTHPIEYYRDADGTDIRCRPEAG